MSKIYLCIAILTMFMWTGCDSPTRSGDPYKNAWWKSDKENKK